MKLQNNIINDYYNIIKLIKFIKDSKELDQSIKYKIIHLRYVLHNYVNLYLEKVHNNYNILFTDEIKEIEQLKKRTNDQAEKLQFVVNEYNKMLETVNNTIMEVNELNDLTFTLNEIITIIDINTINKKYLLNNEYVENEDYLELLYKILIETFYKNEKGEA